VIFAARNTKGVDSIKTVEMPDVNTVLGTFETTTMILAPDGRPIWQFGEGGEAFDVKEVMIVIETLRNDSPKAPALDSPGIATAVSAEHQTSPPVEGKRANRSDQHTSNVDAKRDVLASLTGVVHDKNGSKVAFVDSWAGREARRGHRPMVLNFWATSCGPCREEMPELDALRARHPGVLFVGLLAEEPSRYPKVLALTKNTRLKLQYFVEDNRLRQQVFGDSSELIPAFAMLDDKGQIVSKMMGPLRAEANLATLERFLDASSATRERKR
jgi:thiol-disulfide isomerase/thioredoxin